jgi:hypothetical protein
VGQLVRERVNGRISDVRARLGLEARALAWPGRARAFQNLRPGPHAGLGLGLGLAWPKPWPGSIIFSKMFMV